MWRSAFEVLCDRRIIMKLKEKIIGPSLEMLHGSKYCAVNKQHIKKECNIKENVEMDEWQHINRYKRNEYFPKS